MRLLDLMNGKSGIPPTHLTKEAAAFDKENKSGSEEDTGTHTPRLSGAQGHTLCLTFVEFQGQREGHAEFFYSEFDINSCCC